jgi:peptidoglycan/xylan/chitin deacetylase (PgdA/CDA1 family)
LDGVRSARPERVARRVIEHLADGAIVLMHDAAEHDDFTPASLAALPEILRVLRERELTAVGIEDLPR